MCVSASLSLAQKNPLRATLSRPSVLRNRNLDVLSSSRVVAKVTEGPSKEQYVQLGLPSGSGTVGNCNGSLDPHRTHCDTSGIERCGPSGVLHQRESQVVFSSWFKHHEAVHITDRDPFKEHRRQQPVFAWHERGPKSSQFQDCRQIVPLTNLCPSSG